MTAITISDLTNAKLDVDHIAEFATSVALTATDRLGHTKTTIQGAANSIAADVAEVEARKVQALAVDIPAAIDTIKAFNNRGAWVPVTAYAGKDLVSVSGSWYVCVVPHPSSATFAADTASKWRLYQGVTSADLSSPNGSKTIGRLKPGPGASNSTVDADLASIETRYTYNINPTTFAVTHNANVNAVNCDKQIYLFGDSHGWGQGSPEWDQFAGASYASHSASLFNRGFMARIEAYIKHKIGADDRIYSFFGNVGHRILPNDSIGSDSVASGVEYLSAPLRVAHGAVIASSTDVVPAVSSYPAWFTPFANNGATDMSYNIATYREKLFKGRFNRALGDLHIESEANFIECGKAEYLTLLPIPGLAASGGGYTSVLDGTGTILAEFDATNFYLRVSAKTPYGDLGFFGAAGQAYFIPGYGKVVAGAGVAYGALGVGIKLFAADGASFPTGLDKYIRSGMHIYMNDYIAHTTVYADPSVPFRKLYIALRKGPSARNLDLYMADAATGSLDVKPWSHNINVVGLSTVPFWNFGRAGYPMVTKLDPSGTRSDATASGVTISGTSKVTFNLYSATEQDVVYCVDFGSKVHGRVFLDDAGFTAPSTAVSSRVRGMLFDNNGVSNFSMGAHSVGDWMGTGASLVDAAHDHLADIIAYTKTTPFLVVTELPFVNEYIRQTPIATFKANIATFISRLNNTLNPGAAKATDFLFFSTVGGCDVDYAGAASSAINYDAYVTAAKEQCLTSGAGFVDCRAMLKDLVQRGVVNYARLYADNNHPSNFANELISRKLVDVLDEVI